ncbi:P-loop NTPase fold protein [Amycolatopsis japonica]|uniref:P-loop NTPase fold protein n=1 Tax=Amycolatopsis japonica TaxID=208439 RepID=UPI003326752C
MRLAAGLSGGERLVADQMFPESAPVHKAGQLAGLPAETQPPKPIGSPDPFAAHVADYRPDTDDGVDRLGIGTDVRMLADLVVSRMITPPLSIGLFGSWGSGKSFFMRQMQLRVRELADSARTAGTDSTPGITARRTSSPASPRISSTTSPRAAPRTTFSARPTCSPNAARPRRRCSAGSARSGSNAEP